MTAWLVETYWPGGAGALGQVEERLRAAQGRVAVRLVGVVHVPTDEMALWRFEAPSAEVLRSALESAALTFERILEVVDLPASDDAPIGLEPGIAQADP